MRTIRQIQAARRNGSRARGPITPAGAERSARNATTHGLTASSVLLDNESPAGFKRLLHALLDEFATEGEHLCVEQVAAKWRLRRAVGYETALIDAQLPPTDAGDQPHAAPAAPCFRHLNRGESARHRANFRALAELGYRQNTKLRNEPESPQTQEAA